jgi:8-amino-7-oxononanoate synthase
MKQKIAHLIKHRKQNGLYRWRILNNLNWINFASNDYLNIKNNVMHDNGFHYTKGGHASPLLGGYTAFQSHVKARLCDYFGVEDMLFFTSGFMANLAIIQMLEGLSANILIDKSIHASFYEGLKRYPHRLFRFPHQQYALMQKIDSSMRPDVIILESLYSMSCHHLPLFKVLASTTTPLIIDESHAVGILGEKGLGIVPPSLSYLKAIPLRMIGCGKAIGLTGGIVMGDRDWIDAMCQLSKCYQYSTSVSDDFMNNLLKRLELIMTMDEERAHLNALIDYFKQGVNASQWTFLESHTPIQYLVIGDVEQSCQLHNYLQQKGIQTALIRTPTVAPKMTGLRISFHAGLSFSDVDSLLSGLHLFIKASSCNTSHANGFNVRS